MVTRLCIPLSVAALLCAAPGCKKDNAKPDPAALKDAAGTGVAAKPADAAAAAAVTGDAGAVAAATADAGARSAPPGADAGAAAGGDAAPKNLKVLPKTWTTAKVND